MNRKLLFVFVVLIAAVAALGIVSAGETVSVDGVSFTLPDGYSGNSSSTGNLGIYTDNQGGLIMIWVGNESDISDYQTNSSYSTKTIAGQQGYFHTDSKGVIFAYQKDSHTVTILADKESDLETLLK